MKTRSGFGTNQFIIDNKKVNEIFDEYNLAVSEQNRHEAIGNIENAYRNNTLTLVLGAGVSQSCKLPSWEQLLKDLFLSCGQSPNQPPSSPTIISELFSNIFKPSPLVMAKYVQNKLMSGKGRKNKDFPGTVRNALYRFVDKEPSDLLDSLWEFCYPDKQEGKLAAVVTYNYDSLIEEGFEPLYTGRVESIYWPKQHYEKDQIPVYHVHGYLPRKGTLTRQHKIILSEESYHKQYANVYDWSNLVQIENFKNMTCLFIGLSFTDPNLRRLLEISSRQRDPKKKGWHYAIMKLDSHKQIEKELHGFLQKSPHHFHLKQTTNLSSQYTCSSICKLIKGFHETDLNAFNIKILWVREYDEIPRLLDLISHSLRSIDANGDNNLVPYRLTPLPRKPVEVDDIIEWVHKNYETPEDACLMWDNEEEKYVDFGGIEDINDLVYEHFQELTNDKLIEDAISKLSGESNEWVRKGLY